MREELTADGDVLLCSEKKCWCLVGIAKDKSISVVQFFGCGWECWGSAEGRDYQEDISRTTHQHIVCLFFQNFYLKRIKTDLLSSYELIK